MARKFQERLEGYLLSVVDDRDPGILAMLLLLFLSALSWLFEGLVQLRLWCCHGILKHHTLGCQVVSVGNLTVDGTGETPVVEILARSLQSDFETERWLMILCM